MRMIHIHTSAIGCDHVGDVELRRVGKQVGMCRGTFQSGASRVVDGVFLPIIPADMLSSFVRRGPNHVKRQLHGIVMPKFRRRDRIFGFRAHNSTNAHRYDFLSSVFTLFDGITPPGGCWSHARHPNR